MTATDLKLPEKLLPVRIRVTIAGTMPTHRFRQLWAFLARHGGRKGPDWRTQKQACSRAARLTQGFAGGCSDGS